jgi:hypothetical protein
MVSPVSKLQARSLVCWRLRLIDSSPFAGHLFTMKATTFFKAASLLSTLFASADAQVATYTHPKTGITFNKYTITSAQTAGGLEWGFALPGTAGVSDGEYIGYIVSIAFIHLVKHMLTMV